MQSKQGLYKTDFHFKCGDRVMKISGKPFKSGAKVGTIREFTTNPNCNRPAVIIEEDGSIVNVEILKPVNII